MPYSRSSNVVLSNINLNCKVLFDVQKALDQYSLKDFTFKDIEVTALDSPEFRVDYVENFTLKNVKVNGKKVK